MSFKAIHENKILTKISEFTVYGIFDNLMQLLDAMIECQTVYIQTREQPDLGLQCLHRPVFQNIDCNMVLTFVLLNKLT